MCLLISIIYRFSQHFKGPTLYKVLGSLYTKIDSLKLLSTKRICKDYETEYDDRNWMNKVLKDLKNEKKNFIIFRP